MEHKPLVMSENFINFAFKFNLLFNGDKNRTTKTERQKLNRIKAVLAETGHTGKWLAEQLGKDPVTVSKWCTNTSQPDLYTLSQISRIIGVNSRELLAFD